MTTPPDEWGRGSPPWCASAVTRGSPGGTTADAGQRDITRIVSAPYARRMGDSTHGLTTGAVARRLGVSPRPCARGTAATEWAPPPARTAGTAAGPPTTWRCWRRCAGSPPPGCPGRRRPRGLARGGRAQPPRRGDSARQAAPAARRRFHGRGDSARRGDSAGGATPRAVRHGAPRGRCGPGSGRRPRRPRRPPCASRRRRGPGAAGGPGGGLPLGDVRQECRASRAPHCASTARPRRPAAPRGRGARARRRLAGGHDADAARGGPQVGDLGRPLRRGGAPAVLARLQRPARGRRVGAGTGRRPARTARLRARGAAHAATGGPRRRARGTRPAGPHVRCGRAAGGAGLGRPAHRPGRRGAVVAGEVHGEPRAGTAPGGTPSA